MGNKILGILLIVVGVGLLLVAVFGGRTVFWRTGTILCGLAAIGTGILRLSMKYSLRPGTNQAFSSAGLSRPVPPPGTVQAFSPSDSGEYHHAPPENTTARGARQSTSRLGTRPCPHCGETLSVYAAQCPYCKVPVSDTP
jgi:hypothetical protein